MSEAKKQMLKECMEPSARERLSTISLVKPEKAEKIEQMIIQMANSRQLKAKVDDNTLKAWLNEINDTEPGANTNITFKRKIVDSDEELDLSGFRFELELINFCIS